MGPVTQVEGVEGVGQRAAARAEGRGVLRQEDGRGVGVLIAHAVVGEVAVALLEADEEEGGVAEGEGGATAQGQAGRLRAGALGEAGGPALGLARDPLEPDERADAAHAVARAEGVDERGGDDRLHDRGGGRALRGQDARVLERGQAVLAEEGRDLVARQDAVPVADPDGRADAVGVGVRGQGEVGALARGLGEREREGLGVLGVGRADGGEGAVVLGLLGDERGLHAEPAKGGDDHDVAGAVQVGEDDAGGVPAQDLGIGHARAQAVEVGGLGGGGNGARGRAVGGGQGRDRAGAERLDAGDDRGVVGRQDLAAVAEVALEAVVVGRVVAGGDDDAGVGAEMPDGEAELRRGARAVEQPRLAAEGAPGRGDRLGERAREVPDVVGDDQARGGLAERREMAVQAGGGGIRLVSFRQAAPTAGWRGAEPAGASPRSEGATTLPMVLPRMPPVPKATPL